MPEQQRREKLPRHERTGNTPPSPPGRTGSSNTCSPRMHPSTEPRRERRGFQPTWISLPWSSCGSRREATQSVRDRVRDHWTLAHTGCPRDEPAEHMLMIPDRVRENMTSRHSEVIYLCLNEYTHRRSTCLSKDTSLQPSPAPSRGTEAVPTANSQKRYSFLVPCEYLLASDIDYVIAPLLPRGRQKTFHANTTHLCRQEWTPAMRRHRERTTFTNTHKKQGISAIPQPTNPTNPRQPIIHNLGLTRTPPYTLEPVRRVEAGTLPQQPPPGDAQQARQVQTTKPLHKQSPQARPPPAA